MSDLHSKTRDIYQKQHERITSNADIDAEQMGRYYESYFKLEPGWFNGKLALDAGCGNIGSLIRMLVNVGASCVYGVDIGESWIPLLRDVLRKNKIEDSKVILDTGNVLDLKFEDSFFDFVSCNGVLIHLGSMGEVEKAFSECARVCKKGGYLYTTYGVSSGLFEEEVIPAIRRYYRKNDKFKFLIDNLSMDKVSGLIDVIADSLSFHQGESIDKEVARHLFNEDFCVYVQNLIQVDSRLVLECSVPVIKKMYEYNGFECVVRLKKFVKRSNYRKYLAPLHYDTENEISNVLYGDGYLEFIGKKKEV